MNRFVLALCITLHLDWIAFAQSEIDFKKMADLVVQVVDDQDKPISGATVYPYALCAAEGDDHGYWNEELIGPPKTVITDETGKAAIKYPVHVGSATKPLTTSLVTFQVQHSEFVQQVVNFDLGPELAKVTMKPGCEIQLSAIDPTGELVPEFAVLMAGPLSTSYWTDDGKGGRRTRSASNGARQTMIVKPQAGGKTLFSGVLPLRVQPDQDLKIRNVKLLPGTKIVAAVSDNVPRPVKKGYVIVTSVPKPAGNSYAEKDPSLLWQDWTEIKEDGTFEIASIPRGGDLQLIGICDGWLSSTNISEAKNKGVVMGQLFKLDKDKLVVELTLEMERSGSLELTVLRPDGSPLNEGEISSEPNQKFLKDGFTILGRRFRSMQLIEKQLTPIEKRTLSREEPMQFPFRGKVINGKVTLTGLPISLSESETLYLHHPQLRLQSDRGVGEISFKLDSAEPKSLTFSTTLPPTLKD